MATHLSRGAPRCKGPRRLRPRRYKRLYYEPANSSHERSIYGSSAPRPEAPSTSQPRGPRRDETALQVLPTDFDAVVNTTAVAKVILDELLWRAQALDSASPFFEAPTLKDSVAYEPST